MLIECCCDSGCGTMSIRVTVCSVAVAGASVTYTQGGSTYGPWITGSTGYATITVHAAGSVTFTVVPPSGSHCATLTSTQSLSCPPGFTISFALNPSTGYSCGSDGCCAAPSGPPPYPTAVNYPATLYWNDGSGIITTLTQTTVGVTTPGYAEGYTWVGADSKPFSHYYTGTSCTDLGTSLVPLTYSLACDGSAWQLFVYSGQCGGANLTPGDTGSVNIGNARSSGVRSSVTCPPAFSVTLTGYYITTDNPPSSGGIPISGVAYQ